MKLFYQEPEISITSAESESSILAGSWQQSGGQGDFSGAYDVTNDTTWG